MKSLFASCEKIGCNFYPAFAIYTRLYRDVVKREVDLANVTQDDIVLNVGCGAIPFTAVHVAQLTGAKVIAMDRDELAVQKAKKSLHKFQLDDNIEIHCGDGADSIPFKFDAAIVALQVGEKPNILANLKQSARPGARLIFRQPAEKYQEEYGVLPNNVRADWKVEQTMQTFEHSYLYQIPQWG